ncbi:unnamed protein product [Ilex paraguariensis]|uniref:Uncharacterized protein n=1 Tax=Ilex paraguariensis TaxID=185542 RepID=A0ABC8R0F5_9AQUA
MREGYAQGSNESVFRAVIEIYLRPKYSSKYKIDIMHLGGAIPDKNLFVDCCSQSGCSGSSRDTGALFKG